MTNCRYTNFDIAAYGQESPFAARATYGEYAAEEEIFLDADDPAWRTRLEQLTIPGSRPGRLRLEEIGASLFSALLHDDVRDLWLRALTESDTGGSGLRMRLSLPPALAVLPWEALFDPDRNTPLSVNRRTPIVRVDNLYRYVGRVRSLDTALPLRLLAVVPDDPSGQIDATLEGNRICEVLGPLEPERVHIRQLSGQVTILDLRREVDRFRPDIVHVISHGQSDGLLLWQDDRPALVAAGVLRMVVESAPSIRLVLLNACATAQPRLGEPFSSLGGRLLQAGVPAVIAMQHAVDDVAAARFAEYFYTELVAGACPGAVDVAVSYARSNLYALSPDNFSYGVPVLWLNGHDARIFDTERQADHSTSVQVEEDTAAPSVDVDALRQAYATELAWLGTFQAPDTRQLPADLRSLAGQLPQFVQENQDILDRLRVLQDSVPTPDNRQQWTTWLARVKSNREAAERIIAMIHAYEESRPD